jgi:hypothetical protein
MYMIEDMIDLGLKEGQEWPNEAYRTVASHVGLCNQLVTNRDALTEVVQAVLAIPENEIESVSWIDAAQKYHVPFIRLS